MKKLVAASSAVPITPSRPDPPNIANAVQNLLYTPIRKNIKH